MQKVQVNKVTLGPLIDLLVQVYGSGVDYIDIVLKQGDKNQDAIGIFVREEYLNLERLTEDEDTITNFEKEENRFKKLTDEDINQLLSI